MSPARSRKVEQGEATRAALIAAARELFASNGFAGTSTEEIVQRADVTRGALYHHFDSKEDLFRAVLEEVQSEVVTRVAKDAMRFPDPIDQLKRGFDAFLDACADPAVQRIALLEGPSVVGWDTWNEIDERYALGAVVAVVEAAIASRRIARQPAEPLAHLLMGALTQAGMLVARAPADRALRKSLRRAFRQLLDGLSG